MAVHCWFGGEAGAESIGVKHKESEIALYETKWLIPYDSYTFGCDLCPAMYNIFNYLPQDLFSL
jgi:hypothetical protein